MTGKSTVGGTEPRQSVGAWGLPRGAWRGVVRRTLAEILSDELTDRAAALTYYGVISLFPGAIVVSALLGLAGPSTTRSLLDTIDELGYGGDNSVLVAVLEELRGSQPVAGPVALIGLVIAWWTASLYIGAFVRAVDAAYASDRERPLWKSVPLQLGLTAAVSALVVVCAVGVLISGRLAETVGRWLGWGPGAITVWGIAKWPVLAVLVSVVIALLYRSAPNARRLGMRWVTPGSALAVLLWICASAGFAFYATHFGSYNKVYGSLAGAVVFLVWVWLSNVAILLGAQFDAELARVRPPRESGDPELDTSSTTPPRELPAAVAHASTVRSRA